MEAGVKRQHSPAEVSADPARSPEDELVFASVLSWGETSGPYALMIGHWVPATLGSGDDPRQGDFLQLKQYLRG